MKTLLKIVARTIAYSVGAAVVIFIFGFVAEVIERGLNSFSEWLIPILFGSVILAVSCVFACSKTLGWDKEDEPEEPPEGLSKESLEHGREMGD